MSLPPQPPWCERCDANRSDVALGWTYPNDDGMRLRVFNLCESCMMDFYLWMKSASKAAKYGGDHAK